MSIETKSEKVNQGENFRQDPMALEVAPNPKDEVPNVFLAIPNLGEIATFNMLIIGRWLAMAYTQERWNINLYFPCDHVPPSKARNNIHKAFINSKYDYLFTLDSDVVPPPNALPLLLKYVTDEEVERHIVGLTVQMSKMTQKGAMLAPSAFEYKEGPGGYVIAQGEGLTQVDVVTLAATIRTRELMEAVGAGAYEERMHGEFKDSTTGEDFVFGEHVLDLVDEGHEEYRPWVDFNHICSHYVTMNTRGANDLLIRTENFAKQQVVEEGSREDD